MSFSKSTFAIALLTASLISTNLSAATQLIFKDANHLHQNLAVNRLPESITTLIKNQHPDFYKAVVYQVDDHYIVYLLSGKFWQIKKIRVDLDASGKINNMVDAYQETPAELKKLSSKDPGICPDETIQFVAISGFSGVGKVAQSIEYVYNLAKLKYKSIKITDENLADGQAYKNWMSCPNLEGFYTIGPGSNDEIIVGNGDIVDFTYFAHDEMYRRFKNTILVINSDGVYNYPLGTELVFGNSWRESDFKTDPGPQTKVFVGGYMPLVVGASEEISSCFMGKVLFGAKTDYTTLRQCIGYNDFNYRNFGISVS